MNQGRERPLRPGRRPAALRIGLLNLMPPTALERAEDQFARLLGPSPAGPPTGWERLEPGGAGLADLPDLVVVTGAEPHGPDLRAEPFWADLTAVLDAAVAQRRPLLLSCLAAHAALWYLHGVERTPLAAKCTGVLSHRVATDPVTAGLPARVCLPHSRWNGVDDDDLAAAGYRVLAASDAGWGIAAGEVDGAPVLLLQGHPEYRPDTLLREYRRDVSRWVDRRAAGAVPAAGEWPALPTGLLDPAGEDLARRHRGQVEAGADVELPFEELAGSIRWGRHEPGWAAASARLTANWLAARPGSARRPARAV